jgi:hypothetical protein
MNRSVTNSASSDEHRSPFACNLLALSQEERSRHALVTQTLLAAVQHMQELPDGYALQFLPQPALLALLAEFVLRERLCCPFFAFAIQVEPAGGAFWLHLTGGEGIKDFLLAELNLSSFISI